MNDDNVVVFLNGIACGLMIAEIIVGILTIISMLV